jgi:hypothetical protein
MPFTDEFILQEELGREFKADIPRDFQRIKYPTKK